MGNTEMYHWEYLIDDLVAHYGGRPEANKLRAEVSDMQKQWEKAEALVRELEKRLEDTYGTSYMQKRIAELEAAAETLQDGWNGALEMCRQREVEIKELEADLADWKDANSHLAKMDAESCQTAMEYAERIRELEADKARLDWVLSNCVVEMFPGEYFGNRDEIDRIIAAQNLSSDK